jgi:hypothetical protein
MTASFIVSSIIHYSKFFIEINDQKNGWCGKTTTTRNKIYMHHCINDEKK